MGVHFFLLISRLIEVGVYFFLFYISTDKSGRPFFASIFCFSFFCFDKKDKITSRAQFIFVNSDHFNTELFKCYFWLIDGVVMVEKLADVIFAELAKGQEIFHYDQTNYAGCSRYSRSRY